MDILSQCRYIQCWTGPEQHSKALGSTSSLRFLAAVFQQEALVTLADRRLFLVIGWLQLTTITVKATVHLTLIQPEVETKKGKSPPEEHTSHLDNDRQ